MYFFINWHYQLLLLSKCALLRLLLFLIAARASAFDAYASSASSKCESSVVVREFPFNIFHIVESISIMTKQFQKRYTSGMYPAQVPENFQTSSHCFSEVSKYHLTSWAMKQLFYKSSNNYFDWGRDLLLRNTPCLIKVLMFSWLRF